MTIDVDRFKAAVRATKLPLSEIAKRAGVNEHTVRRCFSADGVKTGVRSDVLIGLCNALDVSADWLLGIDGAPGAAAKYVEELGVYLARAGNNATGDFALGLQEGAKQARRLAEVIPGRRARR